MPKNKGYNKLYNKLKTESKPLRNVIEMICYRAETTVASLIVPYLIRHTEEKRMSIKQITASNVAIISDYEDKTLTVRLHSLSALRFNTTAHHLTQLPNETETVFPGSYLRLTFETTAVSICER